MNEQESLLEYVEEHPEIFEQSVMIFLETLKKFEDQDTDFPDENTDDITIAEQFAEDLQSNGFEQEAAEAIIQFSAVIGEDDLIPQFSQWMSELSSPDSEQSELDYQQTIYLSGLEFFAPQVSESEMPF